MLTYLITLWASMLTNGSAEVFAKIMLSPLFIGIRAMDTCRASFGNIQHLIEINEALQLNTPPFFLHRPPVIAVRDVQRATLVSNGNAKSSMTIFDALPIPFQPTTTAIPTFKGEASNTDAKELASVAPTFSRRVSSANGSSRFPITAVSYRPFVIANGS